MRNKNYYEVLGVSNFASPDEIKAAHRKFVKLYHPDASGTENEVKFKECQEAYDELSDVDKRARYDQSFGVGVQGINDIFGFNPWRNGKFPQKGKNISLNIIVNLADIYKDFTQTLKFERTSHCSGCHGRGVAFGKEPIKCQTCKGSGKVHNQYSRGPMVIREERACQICYGEGTIITDDCKCSTCKGEARVVEVYEVSVNVPKGIPNGWAIGFREISNVGLFGGPRGDFYAIFHVKNDTIFQRMAGADILVEMPISFVQACLGDTVCIRTLNNETVDIKIPVGCQPDDLLKFEKLGLPYFQQDNTGDLLVKIKVEIPKTCTETQQVLLRKFSEQGENNDEENSQKP